MGHILNSLHSWALQKQCPELFIVACMQKRALIGYSYGFSYGWPTPLKTRLKMAQDQGQTPASNYAAFPSWGERFEPGVIYRNATVSDFLNYFGEVEQQYYNAIWTGQNFYGHEISRPPARLD